GEQRVLPLANNADEPIVDVPPGPVSTRYCDWAAAMAGANSHRARPRVRARVRESGLVMVSSCQHVIEGRQRMQPLCITLAYPRRKNCHGSTRVGIILLPASPCTADSRLTHSEMIEYGPRWSRRSIRITSTADLDGALPA